MVHLKKKLLNKFFKSKTSVNILTVNSIFFIFFLFKVPSNDQSNGLNNPNSDELTTNDFHSFTTNAFLDLETKVYGDNWSIPYKRLLQKKRENSRSYAFSLI